VRFVVELGVRREELGVGEMAGTFVCAATHSPASSKLVRMNFMAWQIPNY
jgi:hypothetical protein